MQSSKNYRVDYLLNLYTQREGELVAESDEIRQMESETDDLRYLFTDILDLHRMDNLKGLKILKIEEC